VIQCPTAFILGAGTSVPYGFPAGEDLLRDARSFDFNNLTTRPNTRSVPNVKELHATLQRTHDGSLDALLELRPDIAAAGKRVIASVLLEVESNSRVPQPKDDWLTPFFGELTSGTRCLEDFTKNPITLVTYNYDRLLEYRLSRALVAHYGRSEADCIATLKMIPIIHLHGDLGALPGFAQTDLVPFGPSPADRAAFAEFVDVAADRIVIVHEAKDEGRTFAAARHALQSSKQVVMLGFGYGASNVSRLEIKRWPKRVYGTVFGMTDSQIDYLIGRPFGAVHITVSRTRSTHGTREFLDNCLDIFRAS
jgi:hypothetical protein